MKEGVSLMSLAGKKKPKKVLMPSDYLSLRDRRLYSRPGPLIVYRGGVKRKMNEKLKELLAMSPKQAQDFMKFKLHEVPDQQIAEEYGVGLNTMRKFRQDLKLTKDRLGKITDVGDGPSWPPNVRIDLENPPIKRTPIVKQADQEQVAAIAAAVSPSAPVAAAQTVPVRPKGFFVGVNGKYSLKNLTFYFEAIKAMGSNPENEDKEFNILFELSEVQEDC
jgi:hypothetical protein